MVNYQKIVYVCVVVLYCACPVLYLKWLKVDFAGIPWTEDEHRMFLLGLQKLGKGDWRGISRNYVMSRTPTQVASHAQKYFIRQTNVSRRKRRSSLFDIIADEVSTLLSIQCDKVNYDTRVRLI